MKEKGKVLVLGQDNRSCLSVVRSLGRQNLTVHLAWSSPNSLVRHSRYVQEIHDIPPYTPDDDAWKKKLISILSREKYTLVIPCSDPTILPLQHHRTAFENLAKIYTLPDDVFETVFDKTRLTKLAETLGVKVPKSETLTALAQVEQVTKKLGLPIILKPSASFRIGNLRRKNHVRRADNKEEARNLVKGMLRSGAVQAQSYFTGKGVGVEVLVSEGEILLSFQHERVHEPIGGGGSSYRKSVALKPELLDATTQLMKSLRYTGVAMVEFMVNVETNDWILVEINGRFWGSLPLAIVSGVDFPYALYQLLVENKKDFTNDYRQGIFCRNTSKDFQWLLDQIRAKPSERKHPRFPLLAFLKESIVNLIKMREKNDTLVWDDPKPGFLEIKQLIATYVSRFSNKIIMRFLSHPFNRNRYAKKIHRKVQTAKNVLFICKGNICRSPFAEQYARTVFPKDIQIRSCGYYPIQNRTSPEDALTAAKTFGIDLSEHRSTIVTKALLQQADVAFIFDEENKKIMTERFSFAGTKIYFLGALSSPGKDIIIKDPYGGGLEGFKSNYQSVILALDRLFKDTKETVH
ncbi:MAG: ATP-grasp domain-containing protein [Nitrospirae bacterium]|nr:ATP-grasp domain-containing protein [Candidatus Manganitrophaceae bacterium]